MSGQKWHHLSGLKLSVNFAVAVETDRGIRGDYLVNSSQDPFMCQGKVVSRPTGGFDIHPLLQPETGTWVPP